MNSAYVISNWILVSWILERFTAVKFPMTVNTWCTFWILKRNLVGLAAVCFLCMTSQITEIKAMTAGTVFFCQYSDFYYKYYAMLENIVYMYLPVSLCVLI